MSHGETDEKQPIATEELRRKAIERMGSTRDEVAAMPPEEVRDLVYELQVHQEELNIINENLMATQQELADARDSWQDLYETAPVGYLTLDAGGVILQANETASSLLGIGRHALLGVPLPRFAAPEYRDTCHIYLRSVRGEAHEPADILFLHANSELVWLQLTSRRVESMVPDNGTIRVTMTDITERRRLEQEARHKAEELAHVNQELDAFAHSVSHDLQAPLRAIKGFSDVILEDYAERLDEDGRRYFDRIRRGVDRMNDLIENLLRLSRIGRQEMDLHDVDLSAIGRSVVEELFSYDPGRQIAVMIAQDMHARADPRLMRVALMNLLGNAWKYTRDTPDARIEFAAKRQGEITTWFIRDNGAGFDMRYADKLFTPFQRLHSEREFEGTGNGLPIVKRIITRHGGRIWAESEPGKGATFYFRIDNG